MFSPPPPVQIIAFDLGGVLVDVDHSPLWEQLNCPKSTAEDCFFGGKHHFALSTGQLTAGDFIKEVASRMQESPKRVEAAWRMVVSLRPKSGSVLRSLSRPATIWSNTDPLHFETLAEHLPPSIKQADRRSLSYEIEKMKPDPAFFEKATGRLNVSPNEILYLDDRLDNLQSAQTFGIQTMHVDSMEKLWSALRHHSVVLEDKTL